MIYYTLGFIALDLITGYTKGIVTNSLSSKVLRTGLYHKIGFLFVLVLAKMVEESQQFLSDNNIPIILPVCVYICLTEVTSIVENIAIINPKIIPSKILKILNIKEENEDEHKD